MEHYFQTGNRTTTMVRNICVKKDVHRNFTPWNTIFKRKDKWRQMYISQCGAIL